MSNGATQKQEEARKIRIKANRQTLSGYAIEIKLMDTNNNNNGINHSIHKYSEYNNIYNIINDDAQCKYNYIILNNTIIIIIIIIISLDDDDDIVYFNSKL